jgi:hypothetical protein
MNSQSLVAEGKRYVCDIRPFCFSFLQVHSLLSEREESVLAGFVVYRNLKRRDTSTLTIERFMHAQFGLYPSRSWYSRFCKKHHLSYRVTAVAKWSEDSPKKWKECLRFIQRIRDDIRVLKLPLNKIAAVDKVKFRLMTKNVKQIGIRGGYVLVSCVSLSHSGSGQPRRFRCHQVQEGLTVYTTLVADGTLGPLYIESRKPFPLDLRVPSETYVEYIPKTKKKSERRGEEGMIGYLENSFRNTTLVANDMLLSDNEPSFKTELIRDMECEKSMFLSLIVLSCHIHC